MKKLFICAVSLIFAACICAKADAALLSPGISVLQTGVTMEKSGVAGNTVNFSAEDFQNALGMSKPSSIRITSLPESDKGELLLGDKPVSVGDVIEGDKLDVLCFSPCDSGAQASFSFIPENGAYEDAFTCIISMTKEGLNLAPTTKHGQIADMAGITVFSVLSGEDKDSENLRFSIVTGASHGTVEITDEQTGAYKYTPDEGYSGKDSFTFCVTDDGGNVSNVSKITVNIAPNEKNIVYSDMESSALHLAAAVLYENDIMLGASNVGARLFAPEGKLTRSDFLIMAMNTAGISPTDGACGFADAESFSPYERKYIASAEMLGIAVGSDTEEGRCFLADDYITDGEAALIVCRIAALENLGIVGEDIAVAVMENDGYDALSVLADAEIFVSATPEDELSRGDAVQILYALFGLCR